MKSCDNMRGNARRGDVLHKTRRGGGGGASEGKESDR